MQIRHAQIIVHASAAILPLLARLANRVAGRFLLVGVRRRHLLVFDLDLLRTPPPESLTPDALILLAEINAGAARRSGRHVEPLTTEQWIERWQAFRQQQPTFHAWPAKRSGS